MAIERAAKGLRLLVVDDRRDAVLLLKTLLAHAGHEVTTATDAASALELARTVRPHAIISDLGLSGPMSGCQLARQVLADKTQPAPRLVAVTGYDDQEHRRMAKDAGFEQYMVKPVSIEDLLRVLKPIQADVDRAGNGLSGDV